MLANFSSRSVDDHVTSSYIRSYIRFFAFSKSHPTVTRYTFLYYDLFIVIFT